MRIIKGALALAAAAATYAAMVTLVVLAMWGVLRGSGLV